MNQEIENLKRQISANLENIEIALQTGDFELAHLRSEQVTYQTRQILLCQKQAIQEAYAS